MRWFSSPFGISCTLNVAKVQNVQSCMYFIYLFFLFVNLNVSRSFRLSHKHYSSDKSKYKTADCIERLPFVIIVLLRGAQGPFYFLSDDWIPASLPRRVVFWCVTTSFVVFQSSWDQFPLFTWLWPRNMTPPSLSFCRSPLLNCSSNGNLHFYWTVMNAQITLKVMEAISLW